MGIDGVEQRPCLVQGSLIGTASDREYRRQSASDTDKHDLPSKIFCLVLSVDADVCTHSHDVSAYVCVCVSSSLRAGCFGRVSTQREMAARWRMALGWRCPETQRRLVSRGGELDTLRKMITMPMSGSSSLRCDGLPLASESVNAVTASMTDFP